VDRRFFLASLIAGASAALAQPAGRGRVRVLAILTDAPARPERLIARLAEYGHVEGRTLRVDIRRVAVDASAAELQQAARAMVRAAPDALLAMGVLHLRALAAATSRIPIICGGVSNPVGLGFAKSLAQPGGNITGFSYGLPEAAALQLGTLRELRPTLRRVHFLDTQPAVDITPEHADAAAMLGLELRITGLSSLPDAEGLFARMDHAADAAWIGRLPARIAASDIAAVALRRGIPTHGYSAQDVRAGMLFSYWLGHSEGGRRIAVVIDKVLRGADPARIPFELPDRAELYLNRATAASIGASFSKELILRAVEVW